MRGWLSGDMTTQGMALQETGFQETTIQGMALPEMALQETALQELALQEMALQERLPGKWHCHRSPSWGDGWMCSAFMVVEALGSSAVSCPAKWGMEEVSRTLRGG